MKIKLRTGHCEESRLRRDDEAILSAILNANKKAPAETAEAQYLN